MQMFNLIRVCHSIVQMDCVSAGTIYGAYSAMGEIGSIEQTLGIRYSTKEVLDSRTKKQS